MQNAGELGVSDLLGVGFKRIALKYRTKLYAALGGAAFWVLALGAGLRFADIWALAVALAPALLAGLVPRYAAIVVAIEDVINRKLARADRKSVV